MARHRWIFLLPLSFIFLSLVVITWPTVRWSFEWWEFGMIVPTQTATPDESSPLPPIVISDDSTVAFGDLRFDGKDRDLEALMLRLQAMAPDVGPTRVLEIHPSPECRYERLVEVLSAVRRAGIRHYQFR